MAKAGREPATEKSVGEIAMARLKITIKSSLVHLNTFCGILARNNNSENRRLPTPQVPDYKEELNFMI